MYVFSVHGAKETHWVNIKAWMERRFEKIFPLKKVKTRYICE